MDDDVANNCFSYLLALAPAFTPSQYWQYTEVPTGLSLNRTYFPEPAIKLNVSIYSHVCLDIL